MNALDSLLKEIDKVDGIATGRTDGKASDAELEEQAALACAKFLASRKGMVFVTVEGGLVESVTTSDDALAGLLNEVGVAVVDFDTEGADQDEILTVKMKTPPGQPGEVREAVGHVELVEDATIEKVSF